MGLQALQASFVPAAVDLSFPSWVCHLQGEVAGSTSLFSAFNFSASSTFEARAKIDLSLVPHANSEVLMKRAHSPSEASINLIQPIETISYAIFSRTYISNWVCVGLR